MFFSAWIFLKEFRKTKSKNNNLCIIHSFIFLEKTINGNKACFSFFRFKPKKEKRFLLSASKNEKKKKISD